MRTSFLILLALALLLPAAALSEARPAPGSLSIEGGRGTVALKGQGGVLGKVDGVLQIVDMTPNDRWAPIVNGEVVSGPSVRLRGSGISFRLLGGRFKLVLRGEAIAVSARGRGVAVLKAEPDLLGAAGLFSTDANADCVAMPEACQLFPDQVSRVPYGVPAGQPDGEEMTVTEEKIERGKNR
jgi:hypothetical protein